MQYLQYCKAQYCKFLDINQLFTEVSYSANFQTSKEIKYWKTDAISCPAFCNEWQLAPQNEATALKYQFNYFIK